MDGQRTGSAKKYLPYHNVLILHKSKKQTVKDPPNKRTARASSLITGNPPIRPYKKMNAKNIVITISYINLGAYDQVVRRMALRIFWCFGYIYVF